MSEDPWKSLLNRMALFLSKKELGFALCRVEKERAEKGERVSVPSRRKPEKESRKHPAGRLGTLGSCTHP
jgi:hypothetical protein